MCGVSPRRANTGLTVDALPRARPDEITQLLRKNVSNAGVGARVGGALNLCACTLASKSVVNSNKSIFVDFF